MVCFLCISVILVQLLALLTVVGSTDDLSPDGSRVTPHDLEWDERGYILFCLCMGRFGNQAEHFLGGLAFAKAVDRTLILPPWRTYKNVPFNEWFDVTSVGEYHRVITAEDFMEKLAPKYWPQGNRTGYCFGYQGSSDPPPPCQGRTTAEVRFECGTPPLIIAVNLYYLRRFIPNSQSVDFTEIVELFGGRYMMFLFTLVRPDSSENGPGHYMSYVFRPDGGGEVDSDGIPVGNWNWYPNNENGDLRPLTPGQPDPEGTIPSYVYFILVPPSSSGGATSSGRGEQCPKKEGEDNEE
ncbi:uncharacterized protein LOC117326599 [Pecten maximus]|uniref:uncharacterized protein LOC117326599 n=1 Tax=Pecten maximus TaxID=6579 RepID=UPI001458E121|nr:uncharacterized protein LOC117326599 [Pecten maximus]